MTRHRAVLGCDVNPDYSFYLPIVCLSWQRMGYRPLVLLVGDSGEWLSDPRRRLEADRVRETGAEVYWLGKFSGVRTSTAAQVSRIFAAHVPGVEDDDYLLTSDVDMLPIGSWVGGGRDEGRDLQIYYANAYDQSKYPHYPMCYVGARAVVWREIVDCTLGLSSCLRATLAIAPEDERRAWDYDEWLLGNLIQKWAQRRVRGRLGVQDVIWDHPDVQPIPRTFVEGEWRIDRSSWDETMAEVEKRGSLAGVADAHLPRPGYNEVNWSRVRRVLELALSAVDLAWANDYRERWVHAAS